MMEFSANVAEVKEFIKGITEMPGRFFNMIRYSVRDKESASRWREFIRDLKRRGLDGSKV